MQLLRNLLALCVLITSSAVAGALGTAFTYQGQLTFNSSPASGNFDFKFDLYTAASGGVAINSISQPALPVSSGLINTTLDYTNIPFNGQALWIEVSVRPAGGGVYTVLSPRQSITVTPYALFALQGNGGGGLTLPFSGAASTSSTALAVTNSGTGKGLFGSGTSGNAVEGSSSTGSGVKGVTAGTSGQAGAAGVWGDSHNYWGAWGSSVTADGVHGNSTSASGVFGGSSSGAGMWGDSGTFDGVHGVTHNPNNNTSGVAGFGDGGNFGVFGLSTSGAGVRGVSTSGDGVWASSSSAYGVYATSDGSDGVRGYTSNPNGNTSGVAGAGAGANQGVAGTSVSGTGVSGGSTSGAGVVGGSSSGTGVYGNSSSGAGVWGDSGTFDGVHGHTANPSNNTSGVAGFGDGSNYGVFGYSATGQAVHGYSPTGNGGAFYTGGGANYTALWVQGSQGFAFIDGGGTVWGHAFNTTGVDYSDRLPAETGIDAADVVVIGADGVLRRSTHANETDVAGVYSTRPGVVGRQEEETRATIPVALAGVVPVKAVVENGAIHPGDLLVSSSSPGRAMRAPSDPRPGTVIGKAMQPLENGEGRITMLVMLR